jgi:hypothetical protein
LEQFSAPAHFPDWSGSLWPRLANPAADKDSERLVQRFCRISIELAAIRLEQASVAAS